MSYSTLQQIEKGKIEELSKIFNQNILSNSNILETIKALSKDGELPKELRPIAWKIFLNNLPNNSDIKEWIEKTNEQRLKYKKKFKKYLSIKKYKGDPLGGGNIQNNNKKSERDYNTLHEENELRRIINLDIVRTYQNINLFSQENIKKILLNILFIWSKENDDISYRQGMNELLAILIICFYPYYFTFKDIKKPTKNDIINYLNINDENEKNKYLIKIYNYFYDEDEIESDLFFAFDSLMKKGMKNLFNPKTLQKNEPDYKLYELFSDIFKDDLEEDKSNYISRRCFLLIHEKLKLIDEELYQYFKKTDINCGGFLQKWLRCLFAREFELNQVFILWDIILVQDFINEKNQKYSLLFMDCICLSMIIRIRNIILKKDQNDCLTLLFKYPHINNIKDIIILSYNIYQIINERIKGKKIDPKIILNIAKSFWDNDNEDFSDINNNKSFFKLFDDKPNSLNKENNKNKEEYNIKNIFLENNNNNYSSINKNYEYQTNTFLNDAFNSLGKIGNKIKDHIKIAKDAMLGLEDNEIKNEGNNSDFKKENKMSDLFDIPNLNKEKEINNNMTNNYNENKKDFSNIIKRLQRMDNKYNKYFDEEDKNELENIIKELSK